MRPTPSFELMEHLAKAAETLGSDLEDVRILTPIRCDCCQDSDKEAFPYHVTISGRFWADLCNGCYEALHVEESAAYYAALELVEQIEQNLQSGAHHYWDKQGRLLRTLNQVVDAILADELMG